MKIKLLSKTKTLATGRGLMLFQEHHLLSLHVFTSLYLI